MKRKRLPHVGIFKVVAWKNKKELRLKGPNSPDHACMSDAQVRDTFIWLGNYLAMKNKLPKHITLNQIAVKSSRVEKDIRSLIALEILEKAKKRPY